MSHSIPGVRNSFQSLRAALRSGVARRPRLRKRRDNWQSPVSICAEVLEARALLSAGAIDTTYGSGGATAAGGGNISPMPTNSARVTPGRSDRARRKKNPHIHTKHQM